MLWATRWEAEEEATSVVSCRSSGRRLSFFQDPDGCWRLAFCRSEGRGGGIPTDSDPPPPRRIGRGCDVCSIGSTGVIILEACRCPFPWACPFPWGLRGFGGGSRGVVVWGVMLHGGTVTSGGAFGTMEFTTNVRPSDHPPLRSLSSLSPLLSPLEGEQRRRLSTSATSIHRIGTRHLTLSEKWCEDPMGDNESANGRVYGKGGP